MNVPRHLRRLQEHAQTLGLSLLVAPSKEDALRLPDLAWIRNVRIIGQAPKLPWMLHGERDGREVAVFQDPLVFGCSVFAARTPYDGPEIRVEHARGAAPGFLSLVCVFVMFAGGAVYGFAVSNKFSAAVASFVALAVALQLFNHLRGWIRSRKALASDTNRIEFDDPVFSRVFRVLSSDHDIAQTILTSSVRQLMLATPGASWWTVGHGWISGVTRSELVPLRHFGIPLRKGMSLQRIDGTIDAVVQVANAIEYQAGDTGLAMTLGR